MGVRGHTLNCGEIATNICIIMQRSSQDGLVLVVCPMCEDSFRQCICNVVLLNASEILWGSGAICTTTTVVL